MNERLYSGFGLSLLATMIQTVALAPSRPEPGEGKNRRRGPGEMVSRKNHAATQRKTPSSSLERMLRAGKGRRK